MPDRPRSAARRRLATRLAAIAVASCIWAVATATARAQFDPRQVFGRLVEAANPSAQLVSRQPHPAVVRVVVPEPGGASLGSGTLVDTNGRFGLVLTNWHVIADGTAAPEVIFPDGFRSSALVVKTDRDWDLAALVVWRPRVEPVALSSQTPQPGEWLTIAGYGSGDYRAIAGRCTQYVSPGRQFPPEMVELSAAARQGDSGGPIFNARGELAGVLFGAGFNTTSGSHCLRVRKFLEGVMPDVPPGQQLDANTLAADSSSRAPESHPDARPAPLTALDGRIEPSWRAADAHRRLADVAAADAPTNNIATSQPMSSAPMPPDPPPHDVAQSTPPTAGHWPPTEPMAEEQFASVAAWPRPKAVATSAASPHLDTSLPTPDLWQQVVGVTPLDHVKTVLALVALFLLTTHGWRSLQKD